jgi:superfamily II DNA or RNA helicase
MNKEKKLKHQLATIIGQEEKGVFFVVGFVEGLKGKTANLKPIGSQSSQVIRGVPIENLEYAEPPRRDSIDCFCRIVVQALKPNLGELDRSIFHCNTIFKPYQFRPLLKYVRNPEKRILVADETGLGKTIEAGYILINEMSKTPINRVLILCPSNIQYKWKGELWHRFGLGFDIVSGKKLFELLMDKRRKFHCIASLDAIRSAREDALLKIPTENELDMLIVDEIHHLIGRGEETLRRKLGLALSYISKRFIGLSATPVHLELHDLKKILDVVKPGFKTVKQFDDEMVINSHLNTLCKMLGINPWKEEELERFLKEVEALEKAIENQKQNRKLRDLTSLLYRTKARAMEIKRDKKVRYELRKEIRKKNTLSGIFVRARRVEVGEDRNRIVHNERISPDSDFYEAFQNGGIVRVSEKSLFEEIDEFLRVSFGHVHRRQLSSCLPAMIGLLREGMRGFNVWVGDRWEEIKVSLDEDEREKSSTLANKYGLLTKDSKWERLMEIVRKLRYQESIRKAVVFTQWIPTIKYFRQRKTELDFPCYVVSGQDREQTRTRQALAFQKHEGFAVLFTTDVMSEGIDLQTADCVVNYDLPYNPQKVEQRIGRIDRIGQKSKNITIINMLVEGSTDEDVYDTLLERIEVFERSVGDLPAVLLEETKTTGVIDEDKIIKALSEFEIKTELLQSDALSGLDDVLDEEIIAAHIEQKGTAHGLRWMVFERLMLMVLGEKRLERAILQEGSITFRGINETDVDVLTKLVTVKHRAVVRAELLSFLDEDGTLKVCFCKDSDGLYLPYFHPLMLKAAEISYQSFFSNQEIDRIKPEAVVVRGKLDGVPEETKHLVLTESNFRGKIASAREWYWWAFDSHGRELLQSRESAIEDMWNAYRQRKIALQPTEGIGLPREVWSSVQRYHEGWVKKMKDKDEANYMLSKKAEIMKLQQEMRRLSRRLQKAVISERAQEISKRIKEIREKMEDSGSVIKRLKSDKTHLYDESTSNIRAVGVFTFDNER